MSGSLEWCFSAIADKEHEALDPDFQYSGGNPICVRTFFLGKPSPGLVLSYLIYVLAALLLGTKAARDGGPKISKTTNFQASAKSLMSHASGALETLKKASIPGLTRNSALGAFPELTVMLVRYAPDRPVTALLQLPVNPDVREGLKKRVESQIGSSAQNLAASKIAMERQEKEPVTCFLGPWRPEGPEDHLESP